MSIPPPTDIVPQMYSFWAIPPSSGALNFATQTFTPGALSDFLTFTRASVATDLLPTDPAGYAYTTYINDVPRIRPGRGLLMENTSRTNLLVSPAAPATQVVTLSAIGTYVLWVNGTGSASVALTTAVGGMGVSGTLGSSAVATNGNPVVINVSTVGTVTVTVTGSLNAFQLEAVEAARIAGSSFIPFTGARASETNIVTGRMASILTNTPGSAVVSYEALRSCAQFSTALQLGGAVGPGGSDEQVNNSQSNGSGAIIAATGTGNIFDCKEGVSWDTVSRGHCANGGLCTPGGTQYVSGGSTTIRTGVAGFMGFIREIKGWTTNLSFTDLRRATEISPPQIVAIGDSLVARADGVIPVEGGFTGQSWPKRLTASSGYPVLNGGRDGDTTAQMLIRYQNHPELWKFPLIIGPAGWNDIAGSIPTATTVANIQAIAALNTSGKVLVLGTFNGYAPSEASGTGRYTSTLALQSALAAAFGANFLDIRASIIAGYDPTNPADVLQHSQDQATYTQGLPRAAVPLFLTAAIDNIQTTATSNVALGGTGPWTIQLDTEMIRVTGSSGTSLTGLTRNYGTGGTAAAHSAFKVLQVVPDGNSPHLNDTIGRPQIAAAVRTKIAAIWGI